MAPRASADVVADGTGRGAAMPTSSLGRLAALDAARGAAVAAMVVYHFCWDLSFFGMVDWPLLSHWAWLAARTAIAGSFLAISGASLVLASVGGLDRRRYGRRLAVLAAAAGLISLATWIAFPNSWIFFGILHHLAVASLLGLVFVRLRGAWALVTAAVAVFAFLARDWLVAPIFDMPGLRWLGLMTHSPQTNDYVPLVPWFGYYVFGLVAARSVADFRPGLLTVAEPLARRAWIAPLRWAGRHSLMVYLLHQPVLMGMLALYSSVR